MSLNTLQEYTRIAKYAKYLPEENRRETWEEQVTRVFEMHREYFNQFSWIPKDPTVWWYTYFQAQRKSL